MRSVEPGETCELFSFDLHNWYNIESEGYYTLRITIDAKTLGADDEPARESAREFTIGKPPVLPSIEQYNDSLPVFGGPENEERLKRLIKETVKPIPAESKPMSAELKRLLTWSQSGNGLSARIEFIRGRAHWSGGECFVRLKNVSDKLLTVPTGNPSNEGAASLFDLYVQHGAGPWRRVAGQHDDFIPTPSDAIARLRDLRVADRPWVTLKPGEDCIAVFRAWNEEDCVVASRAKVLLRQPDTSDPRRWSGTLETPARVMKLSPKQLLARRGALPFPDHVPTLSYDISGSPGAPSEVADVDFLNYGNRSIVEMLTIYNPASVCVEFEKRMHAEQVLAMKLLHAGIAASLGARESALFLLEKVKDTDYLPVLNTQYALALTCDRHVTGPPDWQRRDLPDWLVELCLATLSDERFVTGLDKVKNVSFGSTFTVASCDRDLMIALGLARSRKAVPTLIEWAKSGSPDAIWGLGEIGGSDAISALSELARDEKLRSLALEAFSSVRDEEAVPALVKVLEEAYRAEILEEHAHVIWSLGYIGDERAIPILVKLLREIDESEVTMEYGRLQPSLGALVSALGQLKARESVPSLLRFVQYPEVIEALANIGDPAALPVLERIAADEGRLTRNGQPLSPQLEADRYFAARMALCTWDDDRGAARLLATLADNEVGEDRRLELVRGLARSNHPKTIPVLIDIIRSARGHNCIQTAITALGELKHKAAVAGLIDCFDVDFKEENFGKGGHVTPATYRNNIARTLQQLTNQSFGYDKQQWLQWWQNEGQHDPNLK